MKFWTILILMTAGLTVSAEEFNLGVIVGSTTGISAKYGLGLNRAVDGALAYSTDGRNGASFHMDYLIENARQFHVGEVSPLSLYYGIGGRLLNIRTGSNEGKTRVGVRAPFGLNYLVNNPNLEIFGELVPVLDLAPSTDVYFDVGVGLRFRF